MFLSNLSIRQPVFATMMVVAMVVVGIFSYVELKIDLFPNVDIPVISITTTYPGVAPETVETGNSLLLEEIQEMLSQSAPLGINDSGKFFEGPQRPAEVPFQNAVCCRV